MKTEDRLLTPGEVAALFKVDRTSESFVDRVFSYVDASGDCWTWRGTLDRDGYGVIGRGVRGAGNISAQRAIWELLVGAIPAGHRLDRRCRHHACVSPDHGEPVMPIVNIRRGECVAARYARRTVCASGHPLDGTTTSRTGPKAGQTRRYCKTCARRKAARRYALRTAL